MFNGRTRRYTGLTLTSCRSQRGRYYGNKEYDNDVEEVNGAGLQWRAATRNGTSLTLAGYILEVGRGAMLQWCSGWVVGSADGRCNFTFVMLSYLKKNGNSEGWSGMREKIEWKWLKGGFLA